MKYTQIYKIHIYICIKHTLYISFLRVTTKYKNTKIYKNIEIYIETVKYGSPEKFYHFGFITFFLFLAGIFKGYTKSLFLKNNI